MSTRVTRSLGSKRALKVLDIFQTRFLIGYFSALFYGNLGNFKAPTSIRIIEFKLSYAVYWVKIFCSCCMLEIVGRVTIEILVYT